MLKIREKASEEEVLERVKQLPENMKIEMLTLSQQKFLQEMLASHEKVSTVSKKKLLKKNFCILAKMKKSLLPTFRKGRGQPTYP